MSQAWGDGSVSSCLQQTHAHTLAREPEFWPLVLLWKLDA